MVFKKGEKLGWPEEEIRGIGFAEGFFNIKEVKTDWVGLKNFLRIKSRVTEYPKYKEMKLNWLWQT